MRTVIILSFLVVSCGEAAPPLGPATPSGGEAVPPLATHAAGTPGSSTPPTSEDGGSAGEADGGSAGEADGGTTPMTGAGGALVPDPNGGTAAPGSLVVPGSSSAEEGTSTVTPAPSDCAGIAADYAAALAQAQRCDPAATGTCALRLPEVVGCPCRVFVEASRAGDARRLQSQFQTSLCLPSCPPGPCPVLTTGTCSAEAVCQNEP